MPRTCTICSHKEREGIDKALLAAQRTAEELKRSHAGRMAPERAEAYIGWFCEHSGGTRLPGQTQATLDAFLEISRNLEEALRPRDIIRRPLSPAVRSAVRQRDENRCSYCGGMGDDTTGPDGRTWHVDHATPWSKSWDDSPSNLALACSRCNIRKRDKDAETFKEQLAERNASATECNT
jgi:hypothetical protein